jgi:purine nucleosidase
VTEAVPMVIDTDCGIDDAVALWYALTEPRIDVVAIVVTWGNVDLDLAAANVFRILAAAGREDVPVALGEVDAIGPTPLQERATVVHGEDGLGGHGHKWSTGGLGPVDETGADLLRRLAAERPGELTLVTLGPLSTVGAALRDEPAMAGRWRELVVMGGSILRGGNAVPLGEANIAHDPAAAAATARAAWGHEPLLVGLDATHEALLTDDDVALAQERRTPAAEMLADPLVEYAGFYARSRQTPPGTFACHDLLAVQAVVEPHVLRDVRTLPLAVDTGRSAAWGATVADLRADAQSVPDGFEPWRIAFGGDSGPFRAAFRTMMGEGR